MSLPRVCWPLSPWRDAGAGDEGLEPVTGGPGHFCRSVTTPTPVEMGPSPQSCWSRSPRGHILQEGTLPHPALAPSAQSHSRLGGSHRSRARFAGSFSLLSLPRVESKQVCARSSEERSGFLTTLVLVPLVFKPTERTPNGQSPRLGHPACDSNHSLPKEDF